MQNLVKPLKSICVAILCVTSAWSAFVPVLPAGETPSRFGSPVYLRKLSDVHSYETSARLVFKILLPNLTPIPQPREDENRTVGMIAIQNNLILEDYKSLWQRYSGSSSRKRRQVFLTLAAAAVVGYEVHSAYKWFEKTFGSDEDADEAVNMLRSTLAANEKEFLIHEHEVKEFADKVSSNLRKFSLEFFYLDLADRALLHMAETMFAYFKVQQALERCYDHEVPALIPAEILLNKLTELRTKVGIYGYSPAVEVNDLLAISKLDTVGCFFGKNYLYVMVNIPLRRTPWQISVSIPLPFRFLNHTCKLREPQPHLLASFGTSVKVIDERFNRFCDTKTGGLCLVPEFSVPSRQTRECLKELFNQANTAIHSSCQIECDYRSELIITEVEPTKIIVVNAGRIVVTCPGGFKNFTAPIGVSLEINIICNCTYAIDSIIIDSTPSCISNDVVGNDVLVLVPEFSRKLDETKVYFTFPSPSYNIPTLNFTGNYTMVPELTVLGIHHRDFWLSIITVVLLICVIFICLCFYKYR